MERGAGATWVAGVSCGPVGGGAAAGLGAGVEAWTGRVDAGFTEVVFGECLAVRSGAFSAAIGLADLTLCLPTGRFRGFFEERSVRRLAMIPNYA